MVNLHIINDKYDFMESKAGTIGLIAFMQFWMWYGNTMIILIAGILGINPSLYEAAMVDGASGTQNFFYITLPLLKPILQFTLVTSAIGGLQMYDIPALFNVSGTGEALPAYASQTITMFIRKLGFVSKDYGKSAAASMILFVVTLAISMIFFALTKEREPKQKHAVIK
jgi:multiple sugar transport system permease protein